MVFPTRSQVGLPVVWKRWIWKRGIWLLGITATGLIGPQLPAAAGTFVLDFEGLLDLEAVQEFYNDGFGSLGSLYGQPLGVSFSDNVIVLKDVDAGGVAGDFGGEPSPDNIIFFRDGTEAKLNVASGFKDGFSLFYSAVLPASATGVQIRGAVQLFDGLDGTGNLLAQFDLPSTPRKGAPDPQGEFSPFFPLGTAFSGIARSVVLQGQARTVGFDNLTFGSATAIPGRFVPPPQFPDGSPLYPQEPSTPIPEASPLWGLVGLGLLAWRKGIAR